MDVMDDLTDEFEKSFDTEARSSASEEISPKGLDAGVENLPKQAPLQVKSFPSRAPYRPVNPTKVRRDTAVSEDLQKLRKTEIEQLQKRFLGDPSTDVDDGPNMFQCRVVFMPTDPDWPFDVKKFEILFSIPSSYPEKMMNITLSEDQALPNLVSSYIDGSIKEWLQEKEAQLEKTGVYEIVFRPFLRWFDRNLEDLVTEALRHMRRQIAAKAAGFEFIKAADLQEKFRQLGNAEESDSQEGYSEEEGPEVDSGGDDSGEDNSDDEPVSQNTPVKFDPETEKSGTEVSLKNFQLREGAGTLIFEKIHIIIQCTRCKNRTDFTTPSGRVNSVSCSKCNQSQMLNYRPVLLHSFSSVLGYLDLDNCTAFDLALQESVAAVGCTSCSKDSKINGIAPGQAMDTWCRHCHHKMKIAAESVRFAQLQPSGVVTDPKKVHQVKVKKLRVPKDPAIQEGKALPDNGTCKHYKKSYRWFRFPCCGMVYPCDLCHEEKSDGHEMVFANRVVCGFCCKEQPYAPDKPCLSCMQMLTRSKSSHWEGGLGCRNKVKMCKNDSQKYSNTNKTVSKHAQKLKDAASKKKNKLRQT